MNIVAITGNAATDPHLRETASGTSVCSFRIAVRRINDDTADFFTVTCFGRQAEIASEYLKTGRRVSIEGRLHHSTYETEDGARRSSVEVIATRIQLGKR